MKNKKLSVIAGIFIGIGITLMIVGYIGYRINNNKSVIKFINGGATMAYLSNDWNIEKLCIIDGETHIYDFCDSNKKAFSDINDKRYLGYGFIYKINGVIQTEVQPPKKNVLSGHFWVWKSK